MAVVLVAMVAMAWLGLGLTLGSGRHAVPASPPVDAGAEGGG